MQNQNSIRENISDENGFNMLFELLLDDNKKIREFFSNPKKVLNELGIDIDEKKCIPR